MHCFSLLPWLVACGVAMPAPKLSGQKYSSGLKESLKVPDKTDEARQRTLEFERILRTGGKHTAWLLFSLFTGFTFVGWFTPINSYSVTL